MDGQVLAPMAVSVTSEAMREALPVRPKVTVKVSVPLARAALAGRVAPASLEVRTSEVVEARIGVPAHGK